MESKLIVEGKYTLGVKIESGFGSEIFTATENETGKQVAIKLEPKRTLYPKLLYEAKLFKVKGGESGIPSNKGAFIEGDHNIMVTDLLGPSLENFHVDLDRKFSIHTTAMIALQALEILEYLHSK